MNLRVCWIGLLPRSGDYLMSEVRPRFAYRVERVTNASSVVNWDPTAKAETRQLQVVVDRVAATAVPLHARIHPWKWDRRESRRRATKRTTRRMAAI